MNALNRAGRRKLALGAIAAAIMMGCATPKEQVVLRQIKDVVVDGSSDPKLKAKAVLYNPNPQRGRLRKINVDIFVNDKKAGVINHKVKIAIPANGEFTVPLQVDLNIKELGFFDTLLGVLGGKKFAIRYEGHIKGSYRGLPLRVPVKYKDEVRVRL